MKIFSIAVLARRRGRPIVSTHQTSYKYLREFRVYDCQGLDSWLEAWLRDVGCNQVYTDHILWAVECGHERDWFIDIALWSGNTVLLSWFHEMGWLQESPIVTHLCYLACNYHQANALQWLHERGYPWGDERTAALATEDIACFAYVVAHQAPGWQTYSHMIDWFETDELEALMWQHGA